MNDRPTPLELIRIANETLVNEVLPDAKPQQMYALRMIASALGIATRELSTQDVNAEAETRSFDTLYGESAGMQHLAARNKALAADIRRGAFETSPSREAELRQHLATIARAKLAAAYPKGLKQE